MCSLSNPDPVGQHATLRPAYLCRARIIRVGGDGPGDIVAPGKEGELIVDSTAGTVFVEYLKRPDATSEKLRDGWYFTGDIFRREDNGDMTIVGRVDDMIRSGGERIHPEEVETILEGHSAARSVSVVGVPDATWGQMVVAVIAGVPQDPAATAASIDFYCRNSPLAGFKRPKAYLFARDLPRNSTNKVLRRELREVVVEAQATGDIAFQRVSGA